MAVYSNNLSELWNFDWTGEAFELWIECNATVVSKTQSSLWYFVFKRFEFWKFRQIFNHKKVCFKILFSGITKGCTPEYIVLKVVYIHFQPQKFEIFFYINCKLWTTRYIIYWKQCQKYTIVRKSRLKMK